MKQKFIVLIYLNIAFFYSSISAQTPIFFINKFDIQPPLAATQTAGTWYPDRYAPTMFEQYNYGGENVLHAGIRLAGAYANRPLANHSSFYNTQGRKFDLGSGNSFKTSLVADVFIGADWNTKHRVATLWSTACDLKGTPSFYNILGFRNTTGSDPGFYIYGYHNIGAYTLLPFTVAYGKWYNLKIELTDTAFVYYINGTIVLSDTALNGSKWFSNLMLQSYNFADNTLAAENQSFDEYDVYWDNVGAVTRPARFPNPAIVNFLTAGNFRVLAGSTVTIGYGTTVTGDVGVIPGTTIINSGTVIGKTHLNDASALQAQSNLIIAYNEVSGRPIDSMIPSELGGTTLGRGVYASEAGTFGITGTLILTGSANDVFLFKMASTLTTGVNSNVILSGGVLASNIFWQVGSSATIDGDFKGNILALTAITQNSRAVINGIVFARNSFITLNGTSVLSVRQMSSLTPQTFALVQNYPNPFNPETVFSFTLPLKSIVSLKIFDALGREVSVVVSDELSAGGHSRQWNAATLPSGVYFYRLQAGSFSQTKKLIVLK